MLKRLKKLFTKKDKSNVGVNIDHDNDDYQEQIKKHKLNCGKINIQKLKKISITKDEKLRAEEILFLSYIDKRKASDTNYPQYWSFDYDLNFQNTLIKLFESGYIKFADSKYKLKGLKVSELKDILKENNLKISGKKDDLIERILDDLDIDQLNKLSDEDFFETTEKGEELLENNKHIMYFKKRSTLNITIQTAHSLIAKNPNLDYHLLAIDILQKRINNYDKLEDNGLIRNDIHGLSIVYQDMKDFENAFKALVTVTTHDIFDGLFQYEIYKKLDMIKHIDKKEIKEMKENYMIAPGIISKLINLKNKLDISDEILKEEIWGASQSLPFKVNESLFEKRFIVLSEYISS